MTTLRQRLTLWYAVALVATLMVFGATLYLDRRVSTEREIDQRIGLEASLSAGWLAESRRVLERVVTTIDGVPTLDQGIAAYFESVRDYLAVVSPTGVPLYLSAEARVLPLSSVQDLLGLLDPIPLDRRFETGVFDPAVGRVRYVVQAVPGAGDQIGGLLVAAGANSVTFGQAALLRSMWLSLPIILLAAVLLGYWMAGAVLRPLDLMVGELEAISDGRSLHRRLAVPLGADEMTRLALATNRTFARLEQSFSALHRFIADASHELKTPLMVLRAGVERTLTHPTTPPESLEVLDDTLAEINRMTELVENLLTLARADEGRAQLAVAPIDLRELVSEAADTAGLLGEEGGLQVSASMPEAPVVLEVDRARIRQLLLNLVTNAVKYTPAGGAVAVDLEDRADEVVMAVRDTGIGIAPGDLPHVFDRFWRGDPARARSGHPTGTGLGLAITQWIAEVHGGRIEVQSRPGRGTTFLVTLPRPVSGEPTEAVAEA